MQAKRGDDRRRGTHAVTVLIAATVLIVVLAGGAHAADSEQISDETRVVLSGQVDVAADQTVHSLASIGAFVGIVVAMALLAVACGHDPDWIGFRPTAMVLAALAIAAAALSPLADGTPWTGVAQRVLAGAVVLWFVLTARRVRTIAFGRQ